MKIKYYHIKSNGKISKTFTTADSIEHVICNRVLYNDYSYIGPKSLYQKYKEIVNIQEDELGDFFVDKIQIPYEVIRTSLLYSIAAKDLDITEGIKQLERKKETIKEQFKDVFSDIEKYIEEKDVLVDRYIEIKNDIRILKNDNITELREDDYALRFIVEDVKPITPDELISNLEYHNKK